MPRSAAWLVLVAPLALLACGSESGTPLDASNAIDAANGCEHVSPWSSAPDVPLGPTQETAAVAVDGRIYVIGGFNGALGVLRDVQVFDPAACTWSAGPALPMAIHHANVAAVDGTIFVVGAMTGVDFRAIGNVWAWNPSTDGTWRARASMPAGSERGSAVAAAIDGTIYVAGGLRGTAVAQVSAYDPIADRWDTTLPPLPEPRDHACGGVLDGTLFVAGGRRGTIESTAATVYALAPGAGWTEKAPMLTGRGGTGCGVLGDRLVVVGGEGNPAAPSGVFPQVEAFTPATNTWQSLAPMPTPRHGMAAAAWDGRLFVPGGATRAGFGAVDTHEVLTP